MDNQQLKKVNEEAIRAVVHAADTQTCLNDSLRESMRTVAKLARCVSDDEIVKTLQDQLEIVRNTEIAKVGRLKVDVSAMVLLLKKGELVGLLQQRAHDMVEICKLGNPLESMALENDLVAWIDD